MEQTKIAILFAAIFSVVGVVILVTGVSTSNTEIDLRNQIEAQQVVLESEHDKMWKILQQKAGVADEYRDTFSEIYPQLIAGRYSGEDGARMMLFKMVEEDNPDFDTARRRWMASPSGQGSTMTRTTRTTN